MWNEVKNIEEAYAKCPDIKRITFDDLNRASMKVANVEIDLKKTFEDIGYDELDCISLVMELETMLNISINDEVIDFIFNPKSQTNFLIQEWRDNKIDQILN